MSSHLSKLAALSEARTIASGKMLMPVPMTTERRAALRAAWATHTIKRAAAAVRSASNADYRAFGWDRSDVLTQLQWLQDRSEQPHAERSMALEITIVKGH
jgi:hypothetical protein